MQKIKAILIDDEWNSLQNLEKKLTEFCPGVEVMASSQDPEEALELIKNKQPEVIFLDVEMPGMSGLRLAEKLGENRPEIIFTTAYDHFAVNAVRIRAFDYLTKPISIDALQGAVIRLREFLGNNHSKEKFDLLRHTPEDVQRHNDKIAISNTEGIHFYLIRTIIRIESSGNYCEIFFENGKKATVTKLLKDFEDMLLSYRFFRVHNSHLINLDFVKKYIRGEGGQVVMQNDDVVDVSRRKKEEFLKMLSV